VEEEGKSGKCSGKKKGKGEKRERKGGKKGGRINLPTTVKQTFFGKTPDSVYQIFL